MRAILLAGVCVLFSLLACGCASSPAESSGFLEIRLAVDEMQEGHVEVRMPNVSDAIYVSPTVEFTEVDVKKAFAAPTRPPGGIVKIKGKVDAQAMEAMQDAILRSRKGSKIKVERKQDIPYGVVVEWKWGAARRLRRLTAKHVGDRLAIIVGSRVLSCPIIAGEIKTPMLLSGDLTKEDADVLVTILNGGIVPLK